MARERERREVETRREMRRNWAERMRFERELGSLIEDLHQLVAYERDEAEHRGKP